MRVAATSSASVLILLVSLLDSACLLKEESLRFVFENRSNEVVCVDRSVPDALAARCLAGVEPGTEKAWRFGCGDEDADRDPLKVVMTLEEGTVFHLSKNRGVPDLAGFGPNVHH